MSTAGSTTGTGRPRLGVVLPLALAGLTMLGPFSIDTPFPGFPAIQREFGVGVEATQQLVSVYLLAFAAMSEHFLDQLKAGEAHPAMPSMMKYAGTELNKRRHELVMAAGGSDTLEWDSERTRGGKPAREWLRTKANSIEGGTSEIQLGIVAKHILRLPGA